MEIKNKFSFSNDFISLFNHKVYEKILLKIMNSSVSIFLGQYELMEEQSNGQCDYIDVTTGEKFDAKLPFEKSQIELLTDGKKHEPQFTEWIKTIIQEVEEFDLMRKKEINFTITDTKLFKEMRRLIEKDSEDENIVFFIPFPIAVAIEESVFLPFMDDFLHSIYIQLKKEKLITNRSIYAIYPSSKKSQVVIRNLAFYKMEFLLCEDFDQYYTYEMTDFLVEG